MATVPKNDLFSIVFDRLPFAKTVVLSVDRKGLTVIASAPDAATRTALYRPVVGCTLLTGDVSTATLDAQVALLKAMRPRAGRPWPMRDAALRRVQAAADAKVNRAALDKAVGAAFDEQNKGGYPDTRAIVVVQNGAIVAERCAPGFDRNPELLGWSAAKSIIGTLVGLLVDDGKLKLDTPAQIHEWRGKSDSRAKITLRQLLTMSNGLAFVESNVPARTRSECCLRRGTGAMTTALLSQNQPGAKWSYSSGTTNILSRIVFQATGGTLKDMTRFAQKRLFESAGMTSAVIEPDEVGVNVGSSY